MKSEEQGETKEKEHADDVILASRILGAVRLPI